MATRMRAASLFVVVHTYPKGPGLLAAILDRVGPLRVVTAVHNQPIERSVI